VRPAPRLLAAAALTLAVAALAAASGAPAVAAHRGGALLWPENSLLAFRSALGLGVDFLETDVHLTADGEVVVLHDATLDRTTTATGPVGERQLADLRAARLRARDGSVTAEPVPTLAEVLDLMAPARVELLLEIKAGVGRRRYPGLEEKTLALVRARGLADRVVVMGFDPETVARVRQLDPAIRTTLLVAKGQVDRSGGRPVEAVRWATDVRATHLGIDHRVLDAEVVAAARRAGLRVAAWTVNEDADIRRVVTLGVDVVISDRPDLARGLVRP
jgi:glycerophosphoryl diester phosphodiesterase